MSVERVRGEMGLLEGIACYIPGYRGYKEKALRREAATLVRGRVSTVPAKSRSMLNTPLSPSAASSPTSTMQNSPSQTRPNWTELFKELTRLFQAMQDSSEP